MMPRQKNKRILFYIFLFLLIGTFNNKKLDNIDIVKVNKINVTGLDKKNNLKLMNNLNFLKINNLFFLNDRKIKEIVMANDLVEDYLVFKKYPSTLNVKINKTKFLAKVKKNDDIFFLGSNGKLIKETETQKNIPFIFGNFKKKNFFELKKALDESNFSYDEIKNLFSFQSGRWDIETNSGLLIRLPKKNLKESLKLSINILFKDDKKKINKIDLRQLNQIIING
jgi:cell division protein FtsQ